MRLLYNILFPLVFLVAAPFYFLKLIRRGNWRPGFAQRFGSYNSLRQKLAFKKVLWIHAVSVGEANLAIQLIQKLQPELDSWRIVVSTITTTGMEVLNQKLPNEVERIYFPIDWLPFVKRAFRAMNPAAVVLVEAEIWPNLFWEAKRTNIPVHLVNTRLSDTSFQGYRRYSFLFRPIFASLKVAGVHHEADADRLAQLGCNREAIEVTGNMKFDGDDTPSALDARELLGKLGVPDGAPVMVGGSTFEGEEVLLAQWLPRWREVCEDLFLVIVPRHFERADRVMEQLRGTGLKVARRTQLDDAPEKPDVLVVDSTGELTAFFAVATVVFMGKSLTSQGGQNPIEPAALGKPVVFGPFMQNFRQVVEQLLAAKGAVQVKDEGAFGRTVSALLEDDARREKLGAAGAAVVRANKGASQRTSELIGRSLRALN